MGSRPAETDSSPDGVKSAGMDEHLWCKHCGPGYPLRIEYREELEAKPLGTFSLAGQQMKFSAIKREWPWAVCDECQRESRGKAVGK